MGEQWNKVSNIKDMTKEEVVHALTNKMDKMSDAQSSLIEQLSINRELKDENLQLSSKLRESMWEKHVLKIKNQTLSKRLKVSNDFIYTSENTLQNSKRNNRLHKCRKENKKLKERIKELESEIGDLKMSVQIVNSKNETCKPNNLSCGWDVE